jgi:hypothetical protein
MYFERKSNAKFVIGTFKGFDMNIIRLGVEEENFQPKTKCQIFIGSLLERRVLRYLGMHIFATVHYMILYSL